jgi:hypothetical protein
MRDSLTGSRLVSGNSVWTLGAKQSKVDDMTLDERLSAQLRATRGVEPLRPAVGPLRVSALWNPDVDAVLFNGDCEELMLSMPDESVQLIISSPPYNIGKPYEKKSPLSAYIEWQRRALHECNRVLAVPQILRKPTHTGLLFAYCFIEAVSPSTKLMLGG